MIKTILVPATGSDTDAAIFASARRPHQLVTRERLAAGETQRSVARSYNVSQSTISRLTV